MTTATQVSLALRNTTFGTITLGDFGGGAYGFAEPPLGSTGSLGGDLASVGVAGRNVQLLSCTTTGIGLFTAVAGAGAQTMFKKMYLQSADSTTIVVLDSADATYINNSPAGTSRWSWSSPTSVWTAVDLGEVKQVSFLLDGI